MAKQTKSKTKKIKVKKYPAHYLAAIVTCILILEGTMFGVSSSADWQKASAVLDVSGGVTETVQETTDTFQPMIDVVQSINQFYNLSAGQMMRLLDMSGSEISPEIGFIYNGITDFYRQSGDQMALLLDVSNKFFWPASIAGALIER